MKPEDIILLGLKNKVTAIWKATGRPAWVADLPGGWAVSGGFITLTCDDTRVFAYAGGCVHCLDLVTGALLWSNDLPGYGYGLASICVPGHATAPDPAIAQAINNARSSSGTSASASANS